MFDDLIAFLLDGPAKELLPAFQGSFTLAFPHNADWPDDVLKGGLD